MIKKRYRFLWTAALMVVIFTPLYASACGPSPQKVTKEIVIKAPPEKVWAMMSDFSAMQKWHPDVMSSVLETKADPDGKPVNYRKLTLKNGGTIVEKQREMQEGEMKLGAVIEQGEIAVSNYSDAITVKPSLAAGESVVTWVGRFNNKANLMQAPVGQDNAAAITAVESWYDNGLQGLKESVEKSHSLIVR
jgi:mxaD protein